jgi:hypothetical protein
MTKKQFDRLKPATRRIKIAQDVLYTLTRKKNRFKVTSGSYCNFNTYLTATSDTQLQKILPKYEKYCEACAIGALFLSHVRLFNNVTLGQADDTYGFTLEHYPKGGERLRAADVTILAVMEDYFPAEMLRTIEAAFEGRVMVYDGDMGNDEDIDLPTLSQKWPRLISNAEKRLISICKNIIAHKGDFDITDLPARAKKAVVRKKAA